MQPTDFLKDEKKELSWIGYVDDITDTSVHRWIGDSNNFDLSLELWVKWLFKFFADGQIFDFQKLFNPHSALKVYYKGIFNE